MNWIVRPIHAETYACMIRVLGGFERNYHKLPNMFVLNDNKALLNIMVIWALGEARI